MGFLSPLGRVIYDRPEYILPNQLTFDSTYHDTSACTIGLNSVKVIHSYTLLDTVALSTPCGLFDPSTHFKYIDNEIINGQSYPDTLFLWFGKNAGVIKVATTKGYSHTMLRAYVNGYYWGPLSFSDFASKKSSYRFSKSVNESSVNAYPFGMENFMNFEKKK